MHICRKKHTVLVQGITGKQGTFWTERMQMTHTFLFGVHIICGQTLYGRQMGNSVSHMNAVFFQSTNFAGIVGHQ